MEEKARSEKTRMLAGELYDPADAELLADRDRAALLIHQFNLSSPEGSLRQALLDELLCDLGKGSVIRPPFYCDYGYNIRIGPGCFLNHGCVLLDVMPIEIGAFCQLGPYVQLLTPDHPRDPHVRRQGAERADPIRIGENVWIGGGALVLPGVTIGRDAIVAAGAVVTRDVSPGSTVGGVPARPLR